MPRLVVIGGPNGSGKSTITHQLMDTGVSFGDYINADDIAFGAGGRYEDHVEAASKEATRRCQLALAGHRDFALETVMSHPSKLELMQQARRAGFHVKLVFVGTSDPAINVLRVEKRVLLGGHGVDVKRITERYHRSLAHLQPALRIADETLIFDNSSSEPAGAGGPALAARVLWVNEILRITRTASIPRWVSEALVGSGLQSSSAVRISPKTPFWIET